MNFLNSHNPLSVFVIQNKKTGLYYHMGAGEDCKEAQLENAKRYFTKSSALEEANILGGNDEVVLEVEVILNFKVKS